MQQLAYYLCIGIALVAIWLIFCTFAEPSAKVTRIGYIVIGAIFAILAIKAVVMFV